MAVRFGSLRHLPGDVSLRSTGKLDFLELPNDAINRCRCGAELGDLIGRLTDSEQRHQVAGLAECSRRADGLEVDQEARPGLVADQHIAGTPEISINDGDRVLGLSPTMDAERHPLGLDPRCLEPGDNDRSLAFDREHEHGEAFECHCLVTGQVREIGTNGETEHINTPVPHPLLGAANPGSELGQSAASSASRAW